MLYAVAAVVAGLAAVIDVRTRRIPNWLTLGGLLGGCVIQVLQAGPSGLAVALGGAALGFGLLLPFYVVRAMGAGDVKLLAAVGALMGPVILVSIGLYAAIVGGLISAGMLAQRRVLGRSLFGLARSPLRVQRSGIKAPYGVAIASGVYLSMLLPRVIG